VKPSCELARLENEHSHETLGIDQSMWRCSMTRGPVPLDDTKFDSVMDIGTKCDEPATSFGHRGAVLRCQGENHPNSVFDVCTAHHAASRHAFTAEERNAEQGRAFIPLCHDHHTLSSGACECLQKWYCGPCWKQVLHKMNTEAAKNTKVDKSICARANCTKKASTEQCENCWMATSVEEE